MEEDSFGGGGPNLFSLKKPRDVRAGCASGLKSLGKGVLTGCVAIIAVPVYGAVTESNALEQQLQQEDATQKTGEAKNKTNKQQQHDKHLQPRRAHKENPPNLILDILECTEILEFRTSMNTQV